MDVEDIVKRVLEQYVGSQFNIDSKAARDILANHIAAEVKYPDAPIADYTDDDLAL